MIQSLFVMDALKEGFIGIILTLDTLIYGLIGSAFRVFMAIASARLLSSEAYYAIANKVYLVIGVAMLFVLSYGILKAIVDPSSSEKTFGSGLLKRIAIAVVGLAVTPALFNLMYQAQGLILEHDVIAKIFFRSENTDKINTGGSLTVGGTTVPVDDNINPDDYVKVVGGSYTATTIWQAFFYPAPDSGLTPADITADPSDYYLKAAGWGLACGGVIGGTIAGVAYFAASNIWNPVGWILGIGAVAAVVTCSLAGQNYDAAETGTAITDDEISLEQAYALTAAGESFGLYTIFLDNYLDDGEISYLFGISTLCGAFALYAFASFSIDMGIRAAKLAYYQVVAPIPLVMQILPKNEGTFNKYTKAVVDTFLEVFIRISVVYIVIYLICHLQDLFSSVDKLWGNADLTTPELMFALAFLIIGLIIFCKDAPKILGEAIGLQPGSLKFGMKEKLAKGGAYNAAGIGYGGITSGVRNFRKGMQDGKGFGKSFMSGLAGMGSGAARAARSFIGPGHSDAKSWADAKSAGEKAAQAATDKRDERAARMKDIADSQKAIDKAEQDYNDVLSDPTKTAAERAQAKKTRDEAVANARRRILHAQAAVAALDNVQRRLDSWSAGSVSMAQEEADIKFASSLKKLRDAAREEAYKEGKSAEAGAYKDRLRELQSREVSEYRDGWDEQSYNEAVRARIAEKTEASIASDTNVVAKKAAQAAAEAAVVAAENQLSIAKSTGTAADIAAAQAALGVAQGNLTTANTELETARQAAISALAPTVVEANRTAAITEVKGLAKKTEQELLDERVALQREIKVTKDLMEAAADEWVADAFAKGDGAIVGIYQSFLNDHQDYLRDSSGRIVHDNRTALQMITEFTGDGAVVDHTRTKDVRSFVFEAKTGTLADDITYTMNSHGTYDAKRGDGTTISTGMTREQVFRDVDSMLKDPRYSSSEFRADTATTLTSKRGKKASEQIPVSAEYIEKLRRKRQAEEAKSGKK